MRFAAILALAATAATAQSDKYTGPRPPKADIPYLLHANKLVELDTGNAQQSEKKDDTIYTISGTAAQAQTPMPEPIFVMAVEKLQADKMSLFKMTTKGGARELTISKKPKRDGPRPVRLTADKLDGNLYRLEVQEFLENGEYCMSPDGSNQVFCFAVF